MPLFIAILFSFSVQNDIGTVFNNCRGLQVLSVFEFHTREKSSMSAYKNRNKNYVKTYWKLFHSIFPRTIAPREKCRNVYATLFRDSAIFIRTTSGWILKFDFRKWNSPNDIEYRLKTDLLSYLLRALVAFSIST